MKFKITTEQASILRQCASIESAPYIATAAVVLEPGFRANTQDETKPVSMNIALVSDDPKWNDTDLHDYGTWTEFRKGVELTPEGDGIFDFYIRKRGDEFKEIHGNVVLAVKGGEMVEVRGYGPKPIRWTKAGGFA